MQPPDGVVPGAAADGSVRAPARRPELDALRAVVVLGLVLFHSALVFDASDPDFYVKNETTTDVTTVLAGLVVVWAMPALFTVSGWAARRSLAHRTTAGFVRERLLRLGVPLLVATVLLLPFPVWVRERTRSASDLSYPEFYPRFFDVRVELAEAPFVVQGEHFESGHLWFVVLLLAWSSLLALAVAVVPRLAAPGGHDGVVRAVRTRGAVLLPALVLALVCAVGGLEQEYAGWPRWTYLAFFAGGVVLGGDERLRAVLRRDAALAGAAGAVVYGGGLAAFLTADAAGSDPFTGDAGASVAFRALFGAAGWLFVVAILGGLDRRALRRSAARISAAEGGAQGAAEDAAGYRPGTSGRAYAYLLAAVLPLYVLHQPVVVGVAALVVPWRAPIAVELAVVVLASSAVLLVVYDLGVRRWRVTRRAFGMRP
ncbi:acyltransferase family protein [Isoptericola sp. NEAU-Y5]|uniref:Acyltransferase family protein n=1 Tax=Isoptericola luteus TaxID=2879484 RepID=A0ABS7ZCR8_9MICO|nr:acyltransferase family protein [Isoptericola sp. NEAU-Y5]MCA5892830.1 acyltransferase family protein [Isoptericola sp. NEAU-Y5]